MFHKLSVEWVLVLRNVVYAIDMLLKLPTSTLHYISFLLGAFRKSCEKRLLASPCLSCLPVCPHETTCASTCRIFMKIGIWALFESPSTYFKFHLNRTVIKGTLHEDPCTFLIISRSFLLIMRNVSDKSCGENHNKHFMFNTFFSKIVQFMR